MSDPDSPAAAIAADILAWDPETRERETVA
jgi:hypothetical protein